MSALATYSTHASVSVAISSFQHVRRQAIPASFVNDPGRHPDDFDIIGVTIDCLHVLAVMRV
jgi:hypothetical protein